MKSFYNLNGLKRLISVPTCFKNLSKPSCIDLINKNKRNFFQHSTLFETGLSDFYFLTVTKLEMGFQKQKPQITTSKYKTFDNEKFRSDFLKHSFDKKRCW